MATIPERWKADRGLKRFESTASGVTLNQIDTCVREGLARSSLSASQSVYQFQWSPWTQVWGPSAVNIGYVHNDGRQEAMSGQETFFRTQYQEFANYQEGAQEYFGSVELTVRSGVVASLGWVSTVLDFQADQTNLFRSGADYAIAWAANSIANVLRTRLFSGDPRPALIMKQGNWRPHELMSVTGY